MLPDGHPEGERLQLALQCADIAATKIRHWAGRVSEYKLKTDGGDPTDPVTAIDTAVEDEVVAKIRAAFPSDAVLAEEGHKDLTSASHDEKRYVWVIDPIDGTKNFLHGSHHCSFSLAVARFGPAHGELGKLAGSQRDLGLLLGVVAAPLLNETFWAVRGCGAHSTLHGQLSVSRVSELSKAALTYDINARDPETLTVWLDRCRRLLAAPVQTLRCHGSAALELCTVARGVTDAHIEAGLDLWDVAAGWLILVEAGGCAWSLDGGCLDNVADFKGDILACNSAHLADRVLNCMCDKREPPAARL